MYQISFECEPNCTICDEFIMKLNRHIQSSHGHKTWTHNVPQTDEFKGQFTSSIAVQAESKTEAESVNEFENSGDIDIKPYLEDLDFEDGPDLGSNPELFEHEHLHVIVPDNSKSPLASSTTEDNSGKIRLRSYKNKNLHIHKKKCSKKPSSQPVLSKPKNETTEEIHSQYKCEVCKKRFAFQSLLTLHHKTHLPGKHTCSHCGKCFKLRHNLIDHERVHTGEKPFQCETCLKCYATRTARHRHMERIHIKKNKPSHTCEHCGKSFTEKNELVTHTRIHTGEKPYKCTYCTKSFRIHTGLVVHTRGHTGEKPFMCEVCSATFIQKNELTRHMKSHSEGRQVNLGKTDRLKNPQTMPTRDTGDKDKPYMCESCGKCFEKKPGLRIHMKTHNSKKHACHYCQKNFKSSAALIVHERIHTGKKPYVCDHCGKTFSQLGGLNTHRAIHTGEKRFKCEQCDKCFSQGTSLKLHIHHVHTEKSEREEVVCEVCSKKFSSQNNLAIHHKSVHSLDNPFKCSFCVKAFPYPYRLKIHLKTHENKGE